MAPNPILKVQGMKTKLFSSMVIRNLAATEHKMTEYIARHTDLNI
jgi:hypothetical protein